jgi:ubiquinone biosynthesis protein UbiJ
VGVVLQPFATEQLTQAVKVALDGDESLLQTYSGLMDSCDPNFDIVTP